MTRDDRQRLGNDILNGAWGSMLASAAELWALGFIVDAEDLFTAVSQLRQTNIARRQEDADA